jgi:DNA-directed RNA polymerase specialized sigma subunit
MTNQNNDNITCFAACEKYKKNCLKKNCRYWHDIDNFNNCIINASNNNTHTLEEVGQFLGITRMRVCQIEKKIMKKIKKSLKE